MAQQRVSWQRLVNDGTAQVQRPGVARLVGLAEEHFCFVSVSPWPGHSAPSQVTEGDGLHKFRMVNSVSASHVNLAATLRAILLCLTVCQL